ncbi:LRR receptor-like kinase [Quillaja saponaria]|uniref:LRR receptor-like kinase n=1 Tax=Quillaja saponaria TaxID=32244 RepID=A0AAD7M7P6_QUISA|nr:LRR receptor-like kinase [Quillaja saponaria]
MVNLVLNIIPCLLILLSPISSIVLCIEIEEYYPEERNDLLQLMDYASSASDLHSNWTGPPCVNNRSRWGGIACSNWHVVHIVLEGIQLTGSLPPTFLTNITFLSKLSFRNNSVSGLLPNLTHLVHLEYVLFSYNRFSGSIPVDFIELPNLKVLELQENYLDGQIPPFNQSSLTSFNVSYNNLRGPIPNTSVLQRFTGSSYDHNSELCGKPLENLCPSPPPAPVFAPPPFAIAPNPAADNKHKKSLQLWITALIAAAAALVPFLVIVVFLCYYKKVHEKETPRREQTEKMSVPESTECPEKTSQLEFLNNEIPKFDLDDLLRASAEVLGKGNLGTTYKAVLENGQVVVAKRLKNMNELTKKEFIQQMQLLGKIRHGNLVEIISFYYSKEQKIVIYEFVPNSTLFEVLHENRGVGRIPLDWATRLAIIKDLAKGLAFLHQSLPSHKVPHANLKSSNVLIHQNDRTFHSKLTDFGFLPLLPTRKFSEKLVISKLPEFFQGKKLTHKADVYCFGVILLEVLTGRIPGEISEGIEETNGDLSNWVRMVMNDGWSIDILDLEIQAAKEGHDQKLKLTEIAIECTDMIPEKRPEMSEVWRRVEEIEQRNREND